MSSNNISIVIDKRETKLLKELEENEYVIPEVLVIGDIILKVNDIPTIIIERKTLTDLAASIMDGRYREQKKRLKQTNISKKYYIIEGLSSEYDGKRMPYSTLESAMLSIMVYYDFGIIRSNDVSNTKNIILLLYEKLKNQKSISNNYMKCDLPIINIVKKKQLTVTDCFFAQLCQIPSISSTIAKCIVDKYSSLNKFYSNLMNIENKIEVIKNLEYISSKNKNMRIGESKATKISEYLFDITL